MATRIKRNQTSYADRLKAYFGARLEGLAVTEEGSAPKIDVVYTDFKHIDQVRSDLKGMMPEVEFTKLKRVYTQSAMQWVLAQMLDNDFFREPTIYVKHGGILQLSSLADIATTELDQLNLDESDRIPYTESEMTVIGDDALMTNAEE